MKKISVKVALNMNRLSVPAKINKARLIVEAVSGNMDIFESPSPDLSSVEEAIDDLETAWNEAADGGKSKKAQMHDKEAELLKLMNDLAHYVEAVADGDVNVIHLAAMDTKRPSARVQSDFEVTYNGESGKVVVKRKSVKNASYIWQYSPDPVSAVSWKDAGTTTQSKITIGGLTPGIKYWFRVAIVDKDGKHEFNSPVSIFAI
jgi:hypothetical protein